MKQLLASCAIAFSTYSRIPMPQVEWNEKNMRFTLFFFPLVGAAVGAAFWAADRLCGLLELGPLLLDGYCDTVDALASHASRDRKLAILKDSSAGAFAVIWCGVWFILNFALLTELESVPTAAAGFVLSRSLSALAIEHLPSARPAAGPQAGMGAALKARSRFPWWTAAGYLVLCALAVLLWGNPAAGLAALAAAAVFYCVYRSVALGQFGGFTGDLAGWFLQVCELVILAAVVLTERVCAIWF